ncbi:hypothetical protein C8R45DRAFT_918067 [Mycena sanguinolenta]|nr:hypothetical protein C8R45DRAFT_918067 [Mycena sanguinolenta]
MSAIPETSLSLLSQSNSPSPPRTFTGILLAISVAAVALYYASPTRLIRVLVCALADVENAYLAGVENGLAFSADKDVAARLSVLQLKVSTLHELSLRSSLSLFSTLYDTFNIRRSVAVLHCLHGVGNLYRDLQRVPTPQRHVRVRVALSMPSRSPHHDFPPSARLCSDSFIVIPGVYCTYQFATLALSVLMKDQYVDSEFG